MVACVGGLGQVVICHRVAGEGCSEKVAFDDGPPEVKFSVWPQPEAEWVLSSLGVDIQPRASLPACLLAVPGRPAQSGNTRPWGPTVSRIHAFADFSVWKRAQVDGYPAVCGVSH